MKKVIFILLFIIFNFLFINRTKASYDPLSVPNNKVGVHILFPAEIEDASRLVNSNDGDWGYVTIPIQAGDRDIKKWQEFMDKCKKLHINPLIRLATQGDYFNKASWQKPTEEDIVDFSNFLNSLEWPTKNRYVIVYNEVNRSDEWAGEANPSEYAEILSYAVTVFKSKNQDFFIISGGMDNASITSNGTYNQFDFFRLMNQAVPGIFNQIDGYSSHSYPNPAFSSPPDANTPRSISSFKYELDEISRFSNKNLPVFITETGWSQEEISKVVVGNYFKEAFENVWNDSRIVAVTPFILTAGPGSFEKFSLTNGGSEKNEVYKAIESISKTNGSPKINPIKKVLGEKEEEKLPIKDFSNKKNRTDKGTKALIKLLFLGF